MKLTKFSDYSLRVLIVAATKDPELVTIREIATTYDISEAHVRKVMHQLAREGFLVTVRGRTGGYRLARAPYKISVGSVVRYTERDMKIVECFRPSSGLCRLEPGCVLKAALRQALEAFVAVLDRYTLADLVQNKKKVAALLGFSGRHLQ